MHKINSTFNCLEWWIVYGLVVRGLEELVALVREGRMEVGQTALECGTQFKPSIQCVLDVRKLILVLAVRLNLLN